MNPYFNKMLDNKVIDNLLDRIRKELEDRRQFDSPAKEMSAICIRTEKPEVYVRISLQRTYSSKGYSGSANGLRINFTNSLCDKLKTYMVPKWDKQGEEWQFSRSKLLAKAAAAIAFVQKWQDNRDKETQQRKVFASNVAAAFGHLTEQGDVKLVHDYGKRGRVIRKIVRIELPYIHMDLYSPDNGESFQIKSIKPMESKWNTQSFDVKTIKEIITKLEEIFVPEEALVP